ncbi:hypothetical protein JD276_07455 [Leucobacter sp. CSA1]|uniref:Signal peptidase I n=1 Tax=Leucobacter chromiisoli TaxID=2796471 RepID=A0A934Q973_9MICO|nr:hypothetical protein [Leucobacter chromiisoli]MBK0418867.1 hypothetical protein [Leucobacter chromiisoli]
MGRAARAVARALRETLLTIAALGGAACIVLVILAFAGGYSLVMFKTGSMSPTIPAGSVALVREIPAGEVSVGDVLTVDRPGSLPVTHRVTSVAAGPSAAERVITMRGDANDVEDPLPYTIERGRVVVGSVPHLAHVIVWFGSPWVLGGITVGAALLVTWAFWPRDPAPAEPRRPKRGRRRAAAAGAIAVLIGILLPWAPGRAAPATAVEPDSTRDALTLHSDLPEGGPHPLDAELPLHWHLHADATAAPSGGELTLTIEGRGDPLVGVAAEVRSCDDPWSAGECPSGERLLRSAVPIAVDGAPSELLRTPTPVRAHLRIALTARPDAEAGGDEQIELTVRASAAGEHRETGTGELPVTGSGPAGLALAPAAILIGLGAALVAHRRRGRRREGER